MALESILNPVLNPLLELQPWLAIAIMSLIISIFITVVYKYTTNQELMKKLKEDMKAHQKEMKENRNNAKKMMEIQKKAMDKNMQYMLQSFRPMLFYFLPLILVFGWLNNHFGYYPISPYEVFTTTAVFSEGIAGNAVLTAPEQIEVISEKTQPIADNKAEWKLKGGPGEYRLDYSLDGKTVNREVLITSEQVYRPPLVKINKGGFEQLNINNKPIKALNVFGWEIGWLGAYIIFSLVFGIGTRKVMKVY